MEQSSDTDAMAGWDQLYRFTSQGILWKGDFINHSVITILRVLTPPDYRAGAQQLRGSRMSSFRGLFSLL